MSIKTNELQQISSVSGKDYLLVDTETAGTGRLSMDQATHFFTGELTKPGSAIGAALSLISNPNLLDNWYFPNPVNQRGQTEYTTPGYTIDRWVGNEIRLVNGAISIGAGIYFVQRIEQERFGNRINGSITFSVLKKNGTFISGDVSNNNPLIADYLYCYLDLKNQAYPEIVIYSSPESPEPNQIVAVKLEFGPTQTLAFQDVDGNWVLNDPPPNYQLELLKCQRYYERFSDPVVLVRIHNNTSILQSMSSLDVNIPFMVPKRILPVVRFEYDIYDGPTQIIESANVVKATCFSQYGLGIPVGQWMDLNWYEADANL